VRGLTRGQRRQLTRTQQRRGRNWGWGGKTARRKNREIFRETEAVFTECIITKLVIWLLNRLGLCLNKCEGRTSEYLPQGAKWLRYAPVSSQLFASTHGRRRLWSAVRLSVEKRSTFCCHDSCRNLSQSTMKCLIETCSKYTQSAHSAKSSSSSYVFSWIKLTWVCSILCLMRLVSVSK